MKRIYKIGVGISGVLAVLCLLTDWFSIRNMYSSYSLKYSVLDEKHLEYSEIPDIFNVNLGRPTEDEMDMDDRIIAQWQWVLNLTQSEYMKNVKRKRLLVPTNAYGGFLLDDIDRNFICHAEGVNMSGFCEMVEDYWYYPMYSNYDEIDAVAGRRDWVYQFYEPKVPPSKRTVFSIQESPHTLFQGDFSVNNPILASYWRGSDIVTPYYKWVPNDNPPKRVKKNYAAGKSKLAAIVVSHCITVNNRLGFVEQLQKYIPVDVYGRCGTFKCPPKGASNQGTCFDMIEEKYKFYLAFENANCRDYITEKLFNNALKRDILPIVYGAHPKDYLAAAPPKSYIHVEDFSSPKELADYLMILDQDDDKYNEYFQWKGSGQFIHGGNDLFCRICAMLFYVDFHPPKKWPQHSRWSTVNKCLPGGRIYWERE